MTVRPLRDPKAPLAIGDVQVELGECRDSALHVGESYSGASLHIPIRVWRGPEPGPTVLVTGALHGDEVNGAGIVRELILHPPFDLRAGSLVLVPVINLLGFERHSRYLPDRRDLNRCFPGRADGSLASRLAHVIFNQVVRRCDYGIDLHTAAVRRTNYPNVRADLADERVARLARAFGCEMVVQGRGPMGSLRRAACRAGHPTIILEAGEVWKVEPSVVEVGVRGVRNVLIDLEMVDGEPQRPLFQASIRKTTWVRASAGGILQMHAAPGDVVEADQPVATNTTFLGREINVIRSPLTGVVLGLTTMPAVVPGAPVCHIAVPMDGIEPIRRARGKSSEKSLDHRLRGDLATNVTVSEHQPVEPGARPDGQPPQA